MPIILDGTTGITTPGLTNSGSDSVVDLSVSGNTTIGDASSDNLTINGSATFATTNPTLTAGTANGVLYLNGSKVATSGSALTFNGTTLTAGGLTTTGTTSTGVLSVTGNTTLGDASADTVTVNGTITSNLIFTDNTYDIGASGATRPRNLNLANSLLINTTASGTSNIQDVQAGINATSLTTTTIKNLGAKFGFTGVTNVDGYIFGGIAMGGNGEEYAGIAAYDNGASAATGLKLFTGTTGGIVEAATVTSAGYWGIGTSSPISIFNASITGVGGSGTHSMAFNYPLGANLQLKSTNAGSGSPIATVDLYTNPERGKEFAFYNQADNSKSGYFGYTYGSGGVILDLKLYNSLAGALIFGANNSEVGRFSSAGNFGVGVSNPGVILQTAKASASGTLGNASTYLGLGSTEDASGALHLIGFGYYGTGSSTYYPSYIGTVNTSGANYTKSAITFYTRDVTTDTAPTEQMRIGTTGNVAIGTNRTNTGLSVWKTNESTNFTIGNINGTANILDYTTPSAIGVGGRLVFGATYYTYGNTMGTGYIGTYKENAPSNGSDEYNHSLVFGTSDSNSGIREVGRFTSVGNLTVGSTGNIGKIGSALSDANTTFSNLGYGMLGLQNKSNTASNYTWMTFNESNSNYVGAIGTQNISHNAASGAVYGDLLFATKTNGLGGFPTEKVRILSTGEFLVNTTSVGNRNAKAVVNGAFSPGIVTSGSGGFDWQSTQESGSIANSGTYDYSLQSNTGCITGFGSIQVQDVATGLNCWGATFAIIARQSGTVTIISSGNLRGSGVSGITLSIVNSGSNAYLRVTNASGGAVYSQVQLNIMTYGY